MVRLLDFPLDILHIMCANFCHHCTGKFDELGDPSEQYREPSYCVSEDQESCFNGAKAFFMDKASIRIATLSAMTKTCTALRHIAQPYMYHYPRIRGPAVYKLLLRTLVERPDLGQYINELSAFEMDCSRIEFISKFERDRVDRERQILGHIKECDRYHDPPSRGKRVKVKYNANLLLTTILLPFGANLQTLHLEVDKNCNFSHKPGSLPRLKELVVKYSDGKESLASRAITSILMASPALERLGGLGVSLHEWEGPRPPIHEGVKEIWFQNSKLGPEMVTALLGLFPRLEAFTYESDKGYEMASVSEIGGALLVCQDLRFLSLDFSNFQEGAVVYPTDQPGGGGLAGLKKLQKFRVRGLCIYDEKDWTGEPPIRTPMTISNMLPTSITELEVTRPNEVVFDGLLELSGVASQRFPLLKRVSIDGIEQEWEILDWHQSACMGLEKINKLRQAFQQNGVELLTGDFGKFEGFFLT